jgi:hypothetical protein
MLKGLGETLPSLVDGAFSRSVSAEQHGRSFSESVGPA